MAAQADQVILELSEYFGSHLQTKRAIREQFSRDESAHTPVLPDAVVAVASTEEVCRVVTACSHWQVPVVAYGTGTALEGQAIAVAGGLTLDMSAMNRVLEVHQDDLDAVVQPRVTRRQLNEYLKDSGLFFSVDPGADASLGGMAATRASGTNTVRYGSMRENVLSMEVVLADGRVIRTSRRARKSAAGYDLTHLFVGSEGTLGIITELTLRLFGQPEAISAAVCPFAEVEGAVRTAIETIQSGIPVARIELVDDV
ncbi:MAG TPA: FAD-binding protein, partial [Gammaproteobacteria bacterium]|nr:FAD-binding protein [Gammaproteobacteria bacterium]